MHTNDCPADRPNRFAPRYQFDATRYLRIEFCQQVGMFDAWLTPYEVIVVGPPPRGKDQGEPTVYTYEHAGQRFPLIEHKIMAMKAMIFGAN